MSWLPLRIPLHCKVKTRKIIFSVGFLEMRSNPRLWSLAHTRRGSQRWCRFRKIHILGFKNIFRISTFWGRWLRMTTSFSRWKKKIDQNMILQKQEQTLYKLTKQKLGDCSWNGTRLEGYEALDEERRKNIEQLSGWTKNFFKKSIWNFLSGEWLPTQWTAALFRSSPNSSSRKSAGKTGH